MKQNAPKCPLSLSDPVSGRNKKEKEGELLLLYSGDEGLFDAGIGRD
jgi:3-hydroxyisobutyrate dehydrogenase-like beta-hydroxyacid dehydrogenase